MPGFGFLEKFFFRNGKILRNFKNSETSAQKIVAYVEYPGEEKGLYEKSGVKEYLIVFPEREYVEQYVLENDRYGPPEIFNWDEILRLRLFPNEITLAEIFEKVAEKDVSERP